MAFARKLFVNLDTRERQLSSTSGGKDVVQTMRFLKGDQVPFEVCIVERRRPGGQNDFDRIDITGVSLRMAINDTLDDATPLAEASGSDWSRDTNEMIFTGVLNLNTALMNAYITGEKTPYFEIELYDANSRVKVLSEACSVGLGVLQATTTVPDVLNEYYTKAQTEGVFVPRAMENGGTISIPSPNGAYRVILGCNDDGSFRSDVETL